LSIPGIAGICPRFEAADCAGRQRREGPACQTQVLTGFGGALRQKRGQRRGKAGVQTFQGRHPACAAPVRAAAAGARPGSPA